MITQQYIGVETQECQIICFRGGSGPADRVDAMTVGLEIVKKKEEEFLFYDMYFVDMI